MLILRPSFYSGICFVILFGEGNSCHSNGIQPEINEFCGKNKHFSARPKIVGGAPANTNEYPWIVRLAIRGMPAACAGTVVDEHWVLTAAHCISHLNYSREVAIILGDQDRYKKEGGEFTVIPSSIYVHPRHGRKSWSDYDFGLLKLEKPLDFSKWNVKKICLPPRNCKRLCQPLSHAYIAGWGLVRSFSVHSNILLSGKVTILPRDVCTAHWRSYITENMICANDYGGRGPATAICDGDSGGPLMELVGGRYTLCGVTSFGHEFECSNRKYPSVFAKVCKAVDWIMELKNSK